jgi:hypothetical protein
MSSAVMTLASAAVPRTRFSNGIFCNIAALQITYPNSNIRFSVERLQQQGSQQPLRRILSIGA